MLTLIIIYLSVVLVCLGFSFHVCEKWKERVVIVAVAASVSIAWVLLPMLIGMMIYKYLNP